MWSPTHAQVLVKRAKGLKIKGKNGSNDPFVTISLGKEKFQTSVVEKSAESVEWMEQCELLIPTKGNTAEVVLTALHRNFLGVDEFLGRVALPLSDFDHHEKPKSKWYPLECKAGQKKADYRGDLEVRVGFTVIASDKIGGSVSDLSKKKKGSSSSINKVAGNIGGSLMSLGNKQKNIKKLAESVGHKIDKVGGKAKKSLSSLKLNKDKRNLDSLPEEKPWDKNAPNQDPGVNSDEEEDIDAIFKRVGGSSLSLNRKSLENAKSSPLLPSKPQRSLDVYQNETQGKENLFQFDLTIDRQGFKSNRNSSEQIKNELEIKEPQEVLGGDEHLKKKKKKEKKTKRKEDKQEQTKLKNVLQISNEPSLQISNEPSKTEHKPHQQIKGKQNQNTHQPHQPSQDDSKANHVEYSQENTSKMLVSDNNRHFQTYSDEENEDFVVDDVIETGWSDNENEVEPSQNDTNEDTNTVVSDSSEEDDSLDLESSSSQVTGEDKDTIQHNNVEIGQKIPTKQKTKVANVPNVTSDDSDDNSNEDTKPSTGRKVVPGKQSSLKENLPLEILNKFNGKSREDLILMLVNSQNAVENQGKKIADLETYIDSLLTRVIEVAPVLLHKDMKGGNRANGMQVFNRDLKRSKFG